MNQEPKTTIEELLDDCYTLSRSFATGNVPYMQKEENDIYCACVSGAGAFRSKSIVEALTELKASIIKKNATEAERHIAKAQQEIEETRAKLEALIASKQLLENTLTTNQ